MGRFLLGLVLLHIVWYGGAFLISFYPPVLGLAQVFYALGFCVDFVGLLIFAVLLIVSGADDL